jgi:hypothetical protein
LGKRPWLRERKAFFSSSSGNADAGDYDRERARLHAKIGQLVVELVWLTKKSKQLGL